MLPARWRSRRACNGAWPSAQCFLSLPLPRSLPLFLSLPQSLPLFLSLPLSLSLSLSHLMHSIDPSVSLRLSLVTCPCPSPSFFFPTPLSLEGF